MSDTPRTTVLPAEKPQSSKRPNPQMRLSDTILSRRDAFAAVATKYLPAERLVKLAQLAVSKNPDLVECTTLSVLECLMMCARLGLEPGEPGGIWLVKFKTICTAIIDYRGMIDVARRSGEVVAVAADIRKANDVFHWEIDTTAATMLSIKHKHADGDRGAMVGAYFLARLKSGEYQGAYLSKDEVDTFRKRSKADAKGFSPWQTDYEAMAMKTACRRGVNLLPKTPELQQLLSELKQEDDQFDRILDDLPETSATAIDRMIAEITKTDKETAEAIMAAFAKLDYSPAHRVQVLTKYSDDAKALLAFLTAEIGGGQPAQLTEGQPVERVTEADIQAARQEPEKVPVKNKGGRPKGSKNKQPEPKGQKRGPKPVETGIPPAETKPAAVETKPADPEPPKPAEWEGGSF